jgi:hypothetical protein
MAKKGSSSTENCYKSCLVNGSGDSYARVLYILAIVPELGEVA